MRRGNIVIKEIATTAEHFSTCNMNVMRSDVVSFVAEESVNGYPKEYTNTFIETYFSPA
jgi:hypothetical protein